MPFDSQGLKPHQVEHCAHLVSALLNFGAALDGSDTGVGKTYCALAVARSLGAVPLVLAPKPTLPSWERASQVMDWPIEVVNYEKVKGRRKGDKTAETEWGREVAYGKGSLWKWSSAMELVIFDEVDRCAGLTSKESKLLIASRRQCRYVLTLSATAADSPLKLKALGFALGLHKLKDYWQWALRAGCYPDPFGGISFTTNREKQTKAMAKLNAQIFPARGARLRKADIPGFPLTQIETKLLPVSDDKAEKLTDEIAEAYKHRKSQEADAPNAPNALIESIRGQQALELLMLPDMVDLATDYARASKVVLFCNYLETAKALSLALPNAGLLVGADSELGRHFDRQQQIDAFQRNEFDFLICTYGAGGVGVNLHDPSGRVERTSLFFPAYSGRVLAQAFGRVNREGGAFSQQFLCYLDCPRHRKICLTVDTRLSNINTLNDGILTGAI